MGVNRLAASAEDRRGVFAWFAEEPTGDSHWVYQRALVASGGGATDGFIASYASTAYGSDHSEPLLEDCTISADRKTAVFTFAANDTWGSPRPARWTPTWRWGLRLGGTWTRGWEPQSAEHLHRRPRRPAPRRRSCSLTATTSAAGAWFVGTGANDTTDQGRGAVTLSWPEVHSPTATRSTSGTGSSTTRWRRRGEHELDDAETTSTPRTRRSPP